MAETAGREHESNFLNCQPTSWLASMRCTGELHIVPMCPALSCMPSGRRFSCLRSPSCAGDGLRGLVASSLHPACLEALELELQQGLIVERDAGAGGSAHVRDAR